jgi:fatty-acyl-CoA synthase
VVGVPDARWGEVGCALVVAGESTATADTLLLDARQRLAGYKVPKQVLFVDAIPKLGSGKIDRRRAAELALALTTGTRTEAAP